MPIVHNYLHDAIAYAIMSAIEFSEDMTSKIEWAGKRWHLRLEAGMQSERLGKSYVVFVNGKDLGTVWENDFSRGKKIAYRMELFDMLKVVM